MRTFIGNFQSITFRFARRRSLAIPYSEVYAVHPRLLCAIKVIIRPIFRMSFNFTWPRLLGRCVVKRCTDFGGCAPSSVSRSLCARARSHTGDGFAEFEPPFRAFIRNIAAGSVLRVCVCRIDTVIIVSTDVFKFARNLCTSGHSLFRIAHRNRRRQCCAMLVVPGT